MKRILLTTSFFLAGISMLLAQLPDGSTSPDFTATDINGGSQNLYSYLDDNKVVFLDFMATWCGPCWNYHQTNAIKNVYTNHQPYTMAFMMESDDGTNTNCLYGPAGCNDVTLGNWVAGTPYPIIDNAQSIAGTFAVGYYPTIYGICPDKKIYEVGQTDETGLWNFAKDCSAPSMDIASLTHVDCYGNSTGEIILQIDGGIPPFTFEWSNGATTQDLYSIPAGSYEVTVTGSLGGTKTLAVDVEQPSEPLETEVVNLVHEGCTFGGSIEVVSNGGTPGYLYQWSNGETSSTISNLTAGIYSVTTTDNNFCTHEIFTIEVEAPDIPIASAAAPFNIDCVNDSLFLDGSGSSEGPDIQYIWTTNDGNIVSGQYTQNDCVVNAAGTYQLLVTNLISNCIETASVSVSANTSVPASVAAAPDTLNCTVTNIELDGAGSETGSTIQYLWTTANGNIVSGATTLTPEVNKAGTYVLTVTNTANGCTSVASAIQQANTAPPNATAQGGELTCVVTQLELEGNSTTPNVSYSWTGPSGFSSTQQNPQVGIGGNYILTVTDPNNGCTKKDTAVVALNNALPQAQADGGLITCVNSSVTLQGSSTTPNVTYEWTGPNGFTSNGQNPTTNAPGTYVMTVTAPNGCTKTDNATVNQNTNLPTSNAGANAALNCNASSVVLDGTSSSNGNQFSYLWTTTDGHIVSGDSTLTPTVDTAGTYILLVANSNNGCESTDTTIVVQTPVLAASIDTSANIDCFGNANGSATATASGGNGVYSYEWSNGDTLAIATNLNAGTYTVVIMDEDNCTSSEKVTISQPAELKVVATATAQSEPGVNDGTATATPSGGTGAYTYAWSNGGTTETITGLAPGTYTVVVTDENGCQETKTVTVNEFGCAIVANTNNQDVSCFGSEDGVASIELSNATEPFTYEWSNGESTSTIENLSAGTYSVTATDGNDCEIVSTVEVGTPTVLSPNTTATAVTAAGAGDGTATANPTGGSGTYTYLWSTGDTTQTITGLTSANYTVTITDGNGCTAIKTVPVPPFTCTMVAGISSTNISCFGEKDGLATVTLSNGLSPFVYEWSTGGTTATISNLAPGTYQVAVTDAVNCTSTQTVTIVEPEALKAETTVLSNADCGMSNGSASVEVTGGAGSYTYEWSTGETTATVDNLSGGTYTVLVTDKNDCTTEEEVTITVDDSINPIVVTQDITVQVSNNGTVEISPEDVDAGSSDNCGIADMMLDISSFDCGKLGEQEVVLTVVDEAGNSSTSTAIVTVMDASAPQVQVMNITVALDENGQAIITAGSVDGGSSDNCGIADRSIDVTSFTCADLGQNAVVLTVMDAAGNSSAGTAIVTIVDESAPTMTCPDNMVLPYCAPVANYNVNAEDNCSSNVNVQYSHPSGSNFPAGETTVEVVATDGHGNASNCNFTVTVPDAMIVEGNATDVSCFGETDGIAEVAATGGAEGYTYVWSNGETTPSISGLSTGTYEVVVTDAAGCSETQSFDISQPEAVVAEVVTLTNETLTNMDGAIDINPVGGNGNYTFTWTDENGNVISNDEDVSGLSAGNYIVEVIDGNGCAATHTFTIQSVVSVIDHEMAEKIKLFPNPTTGLVTIELEDVHAISADIHIFDVTGQMTFSQRRADITSGQFQIDLSQSATGIYIVRILIENSVVTKRLMVSH